MMIRILCVLMMVPSLLTAQYDSVKRNDVIRLADGIYKTYTSPVRWKGKDWLKFSAITAGTAALTLADLPVRKLWEGRDHQALDHVNILGYHYGKPYSAFVLSGGFYTAGLLFKNQWAKETGLALSTALITTGILEMALKPLVGRARPGEGDGNYDFDPMNKTVAYHSFPSGHASLAFTTSFVLARQVKSIPLKIVFYSLAGSTVICRLYSDAHWISDIAFGGALAWYCSEAAIKYLAANRYKKNHRKTKLDVTPYPGGITIKATFNN